MSGARALQTISRLNRPAPELGKRQAHVTVVDFANSVGAIREAFEEFFTETLLTTGGCAGCCCCCCCCCCGGGGGGKQAWAGVACLLPMMR